MRFASTLSVLSVAIAFAGSAEKTRAQEPTPLWGHPRNDPINAIIARIPSYGGMWVGPGGNLHGSLTNMDDSTKLRAILTEFVSEPRNSFLKHAGADYGIVIEKARYSYAQLNKWQRAIEKSAPALTGIGVDQMKGRLEIGVATDAAVQQTRRIAARLGVPGDAVSIKQMSVVQD